MPCRPPTAPVCLIVCRSLCSLLVCGNPQHGHPWVSALLNNGDKAYDHDEDGKSVTVRYPALSAPPPPPAARRGCRAATRSCKRGEPAARRPYYCCALPASRPGDAPPSHPRPTCAQTGGCQSFFRNLDHDTYARVIYYHGLSVRASDPPPAPLYSELLRSSCDEGAVRAAAPLEHARAAATRCFAGAAGHCEGVAARC